MGRMAGAVALVTGGARGIGAAIARRFVREGARVVVADVLDPVGDELVAAVGPQARFAHLDVTSQEQWERVVGGVEADLGPLSVLVNNAGILAFGSIEETDLETFRRVIETNLVGDFLGIKTAIPSLRRRGGGTIVNISSTAGLTGYAGLSAYVASKWAVRGLTKSAALDLARDHIRVCSVHPGPIRTAMTTGMGDEVVAGQPIARFGDPDEVAAMVAFIVTEATFSTGSEFLVDGGAVTGQVLPLPQ